MNALLRIECETHLGEINRLKLALEEHQDIQKQLEDQVRDKEQECHELKTLAQICKTENEVYRQMLDEEEMRESQSELERASMRNSHHPVVLGGHLQTQQTKEPQDGKEKGLKTRSGRKVKRKFPFDHEHSSPSRLIEI